MKHKNQFWNTISTLMNRHSNLENFKNWDLVRNIPIYQHGTLSNYDSSIHAPYQGEVAAMIQQKHPIEQSRWKELLKEPMKGHTAESYEAASVRFLGIGDGETLATSWSLKSAHHVLAFEDSTGQSILNYDQIVEIGPGIGETARIILDLGFKNPYRILDLPAIYRISSYYLVEYPNVSFHDDFRTIPALGKTLLIGTWSFSELDFELREQILDYFEGADVHFIWQHGFYEYDNRPYFQTHLPNRLKEHRCIHRPIPQLQWDMYFTGHRTFSDR